MCGWRDGGKDGEMEGRMKGCRNEGRDEGRGAGTREHPGGRLHALRPAAVGEATQHQGTQPGKAGGAASREALRSEMLHFT